jgi:hypothetical protein
MHADRISIHDWFLRCRPAGDGEREIRFAGLQPGPVPGRRAHLGRSIGALQSACCTVSRFVGAGRRREVWLRRRRRRPRAGF